MIYLYDTSKHTITADAVKEVCPKEFRDVEELIERDWAGLAKAKFFKESFKNGLKDDQIEVALLELYKAFELGTAVGQESMRIELYYHEDGNISERKHPTNGYVFLVEGVKVFTPPAKLFEDDIEEYFALLPSKEEESEKVKDEDVSE